MFWECYLLQHHRGDSGLDAPRFVVWSGATSLGIANMNGRSEYNDAGESRNRKSACAGLADDE